MPHLRLPRLAALLLPVLCAALLLAGCQTTTPAATAPAADVAVPKGAIYQVGLINELLDGGYAGTVPCGELKRHGDFGVGTFDALDGEMVVLDRVVYQATSDGKVAVAADSVKAPFACVVNFDPKQHFAIHDAPTFADLQRQLSEHLGSPSTPVAIRVYGIFNLVKVRSVPRQTQPYPKLAEVVKTQPIFNYQQVSGTLVGFWCPASLAAVNVPGFHFHFISDDHQQGGHVLDCQIGYAMAELAPTPAPGYVLDPATARRAPAAAPDRSKELDAAEK